MKRPMQHVLRVFDVRAKPGQVSALREKLASTSIDVVRGEPGNVGHYFGRLHSAAGDELVFISIWSSLEAVKARFGDSWEKSFLPPGYEALIEDCSIRHYVVEGELADAASAERSADADRASA